MWLLSRCTHIPWLYSSTVLAHEKADAKAEVWKPTLMYVLMKTIPEAWSQDSQSGAPCCAASLGSYFSDERSHQQGVGKRSRGLRHILPVDHTHFTGLLGSTAYKRIKLSSVLPSGLYWFPNTPNIYNNIFLFPKSLSQAIVEVIKISSNSQKYHKVHTHYQQGKNLWTLPWSLLL